MSLLPLQHGKTSEPSETKAGEVVSQAKDGQAHVEGVKSSAFQEAHGGTQAVREGQIAYVTAKKGEQAKQTKEELASPGGQERVRASVNLLTRFHTDVPPPFTLSRPSALSRSATRLSETSLDRLRTSRTSSDCSESERPSSLTRRSPRTDASRSTTDSRRP